MFESAKTFAGLKFKIQFLKSSWIYNQGRPSPNCNDDEFNKISIELKLFFGSNVVDASFGFILKGIYIFIKIILLIIRFWF